MSLISPKSLLCDPDLLVLVTFLTILTESYRLFMDDNTEIRGNIDVCNS